MDYNKKVDVHAHLLTPAYVEYLDKYEGPTPDNFPTPEWDVKSHLRLMDDLGVAFSVMSVSSPHMIHCRPEERLDYVRRMNDEALDLIADHPGRLGLFATLPLPDVDNACAFAEEYLDKPGVFGIGVMTNYDGLYLGSEKLEPLMKALDKRHAVVCVHPAMPAVLPGDAVQDMPIPIMDFLMDTTRAFTNMVWNDTFVKYPNIRWIWPHGSSFMTILSDRFASFAVQAKLKMHNKNKLDYFGALQNCYFDCAGFSEPKQLACMKLDIPTSHFLYGSDCPYTPSFACVALAGMLEHTDKLTAKEKQAMFTDNAIDLFPQLEDVLDGKKAAAGRNGRGRRAAARKRAFLGKAMSLFNQRNRV